MAVKVLYRIKISNRFAALENVDCYYCYYYYHHHHNHHYYYYVDINRVWKILERI
jgi:hypothetical protein